MTGTLFGIGVGPGDPELVTVRAARLIGAADVVAFHCAPHGRSRARLAAAPYLREDQHEETLVYPVTTAGTNHPDGYDGALADFYAEAEARLSAHLDAGRDVALLAMGDPFLYSSHQHLHARLANRYPTRIVPGIPSTSAAAASLGRALVEGDEVLSILPGTLPADELARRLADTDAAVILKLGRTFPQVKAALLQAGRLDSAQLVAEASTENESVTPVADTDTAPYFSVAVVPGPTSLARTPLATAGAPPPAITDESAGEVVVIGLGPAGEDWRTPEANRELAAVTDVIGYDTYVARVPERPGLRRHSSDNRVEAERAAMALDLARRGRRVAVVSSGDAGVFAMAAAVLEVADLEDYADVPVRIVPGMTAATAVAARVGAPLGHDFAMLSLSDRLKPWDVIARRLDAVAGADMAMAIYNPASRTRRGQLDDLRSVLLRHRDPDTPVVLARAVGAPEESVTVTTLGAFEAADIDMRTMLIVGASNTRRVDTPDGPRVYTSRHYPTG